MEVDLVGIATTDPFPRLILSTFAVSKLRSASPRLHGETQYAISGGGFTPRFALSDGRFAPRFAFFDGGFAPRRPEKSRLCRKNCAYSLQDKIVFVDLWVNCFFGCFPHPLDGGGGWVPICGFSSDLDQNRAVLWSKSEMKHLKHLKHPKHCLWMFGLLFCQHFKELGGKVKDGVHGRQDQ